MLPIAKNMFHLSSKNLFLSLKEFTKIEIRNNIDEIKNADGNRKTPMQKIMKHKSASFLIYFLINEFLNCEEFFYSFFVF
tara:strand:- start:351 stop:590 length:240 start_codon:yes stop_codon:yes gene_type:complete